MPNGLLSVLYTHGQRKEIARQRKGRIKDGRAVFFLFQILLSHNNNHLTAPCGLAAASDVEGERERGLMRLDSDQSRTLQRNTLMDLPSLLPALPYRSVTLTECAHTYAFHLSIPGRNFGQVLLNISGNILTEKAKHKLEGRIKNNAGVQWHSLKA